MDAFAALADPTRRDLLRRMAVYPARVVDLAAEYEISRPAISKHLRILTEAQLVSVTDRGRERHYRFSAAGIRPVRDLLDDLTVEPPIAEQALDGLELEVRRTVRERRAHPAESASTSQKEETA